MTITWDAQADAKLLAGIIATSNASIDFQGVAEFMGDGCTISALKHRIQRIKEKAGLTGSAKSSPSKSPKTKRSVSMKAKSTHGASARKSAVSKKTEQPDPHANATGLELHVEDAINEAEHA